MKVLEAPLDQISRNATPYPGDLLPDGGTGLVLFAAGFLGVNDAIHMARREMLCTCVDTDLSKLFDMREMYPNDWRFICADAWEFAEDQSGKRMWDVVSVDTYTGDATTRSLESLDLWCSLAKTHVTATVEYAQHYEAPKGWRSYLYPRTARASWLVLTRD